ncbi:MAG: hypothetical protein ACI4QG_03280, partial [Candidatus Cryptobacteroides sp.]
MRKYSLLFTALLLLFSCVNREPEVQRRVYLELNPVTLKTTLNPEHNRMKWVSGDRIVVFNNFDAGTAEAVYEPDSEMWIGVSENASSVKACYPVVGGSYEAPGFDFALRQVQKRPGELSGEYYPLLAEAEIVNDRAALYFSAVGSAFALNAYNPFYPGERLSSISVRPSGAESPVSVELTEPWEIAPDKPADRQTYEGQMYVCLEKGKYSNIEIVVTTDRTVYTISTNDTVLDLQEYDFYCINLDLKRMKAYISVTGSEAEDFTLEEDEDITLPGSGFVELVQEHPEDQLTEDIIPDFSTVGYRWGEKPFPDYSNVIELPEPSGEDDTATIQNAIDNAPERSVIQFAKGRYIVDGMIVLDKDYVILRGYGLRETEIFARGTLPLDGVDPSATGVYYPVIRHLINVGVTDRADRTAQYSNSIAAVTVENLEGRVIESHPDAWTVKGLGLKSTSTRILGQGTAIIRDAYCGSEFVTVADVSSFNPGDKVVVYRPATQEWIHDLKMDSIIKALDDPGTIVQWTPAAYGMYWERVVKAVKGDRLYFDAPLVMSVTEEYGGGSVIHCSRQRVKECGIENLKIVSDYNPDRNSTAYGTGDIYHSDNAITFYGAEHCWVKDVHTYHFSESAVAMSSGAKNITVQDCAQFEPTGYECGGLRYAFHINGGQYCLVKDCTTQRDRHQFVTAAKVPGPNVFLRCSSTDALTTIGPHQRWATGTLYDHVWTNKGVCAHDVGKSGTGQGWQGVNQVFWCCRGSWYFMQDPWVTGKNYALGCTYLNGDPAVLSEYQGYANPGYA